MEYNELLAGLSCPLHVSEELRKIHHTLIEDMTAISKKLKPSWEITKSLRVGSYSLPTVPVPPSPISVRPIREVVREEIRLAMASEFDIPTEPVYGADGIKRKPGFDL